MDPISQLALNLVESPKRLVILLGAGVSKDAGLPTAWEVMLAIAARLQAALDVEREKPAENWFLSSKYASMSYPELVELLFPDVPSQRSFLRDQFTRQIDNAPFELIADLCKSGVVRAIVTTNFDSCLETALDRLEVAYEVVATEDDAENCLPLIHCDCLVIYKVHGTIERGSIRNTPEDLKILGVHMGNAVQRALDDHAVLVVGYALRDEGVLKLFRNRRRNYLSAIWADPAATDEALVGHTDLGLRPCKIERARAVFSDLLGAIERIRTVLVNPQNISSVRRITAATSESEPALLLAVGEALRSIMLELEESRGRMMGIATSNDYDEFVVQEIGKLSATTLRFVEVVRSVIEGNRPAAIEAVYEAFGRFLAATKTPDGFNGVFNEMQFEPVRFIINEMFLCFVSLLRVSGKADTIAQLLSQSLFWEGRDGRGAVHFSAVNSYIGSLAELRNARLGLNRLSVPFDLEQDRFGKELSSIVPFDEVQYTDVVLFVRTYYDGKAADDWRAHWHPYVALSGEALTSRVKRLVRVKEFNEFSLIVGQDEATIRSSWADVSAEMSQHFHRGNPFYRSVLSVLDPSDLGTK